MQTGPGMVRHPSSSAWIPDVGRIPINQNCIRCGRMYFIELHRIMQHNCGLAIECYNAMECYKKRAMRISE